VSEGGTLVAAGLAALAAAGYSASDLTTARAVRGVTSPASVAVWAHVVATALLLAAAVPLAPAPAAAGAATAVAAGIVAGVGAVAYYAALKRGAASILAPLAASGLVVPVLVGVARGERAATLAAAGTALLLGGVALLAGARGAGGVRADRVALALGAVGAACFGLYFVAVDLAVGTTGAVHPLWAAGLVTAGSAAGALPALLWRRGPAALRPPPGGRTALLAVGAFLAVADLALAAAMLQGDVALVAVIASADPALSVLAARVVLAERISPRQGAGAALALAGLLAVAAA